jgi:hypothetical protein
MEKGLNSLTINPEVCLGESCFRGFRRPVLVFMGKLGFVMTIEGILEGHKEVSILMSPVRGWVNVFYLLVSVVIPLLPPASAGHSLNFIL